VDFSLRLCRIPRFSDELAPQDVGPIRFGVCVNRQSAPQSEGPGVGFAGIRMHVPTVTEEASPTVGPPASGKVRIDAARTARTPSVRDSSFQ